MIMKCLLTLSLDKFDVSDADVTLKEADNWKGDVVEDLPHALFDHFSIYLFLFFLCVNDGGESSFRLFHNFY